MTEDLDNVLSFLIAGTKGSGELNVKIKYDLGFGWTVESGDHRNSNKTLIGALSLTIASVRKKSVVFDDKGEPDA